MPAETISAEEKRWRRESDARTLGTAEEIRKDLKRYNDAIKAARKLAKEQQKEAAAMSNVANFKIKKTGGKKKQSYINLPPAMR